MIQLFTFVQKIFQTPKKSVKSEKRLRLGHME